MIKTNLTNFFFVLSIFAIDRISKLLIINTSAKLGKTEIFTSSFLNLNLIWNDGIAFGMLSFDEKIYYNLLSAIIILITLIIFWMILKTKGVEKIGFLMIFSGSLGNIFDRLYYASVPDFIDIHINNFHWFIFNAADIFISLGIILLITLEISKKNA